MSSATQTVTKVEITSCSWNVNGINEPVKRDKIHAHLKSLQVDIIFLQETHLEKDSHSTRSSPLRVESPQACNLLKVLNFILIFLSLQKPINPSVGMYLKLSKDIRQSSSRTRCINGIATAVCGFTEGLNKTKLATYCCEGLLKCTGCVVQVNI